MQASLPILYSRCLLSRRGGYLQLWPSWSCVRHSATICNIGHHRISRPLAQHRLWRRRPRLRGYWQRRGGAMGRLSVGALGHRFWWLLDGKLRLETKRAESQSDGHKGEYGAISRIQRKVVNNVRNTRTCELESGSDYCCQRLSFGAQCCGRQRPFVVSSLTHDFSYRSAKNKCRARIPAFFPRLSRRAFLFFEEDFSSPQKTPSNKANAVLGDDTRPRDRSRP